MKVGSILILILHFNCLKTYLCSALLHVTPGHGCGIGTEIKTRVQNQGDSCSVVIRLRSSRNAPISRQIGQIVSGMKSTRNKVSVMIISLTKYSGQGRREESSTAVTNSRHSSLSTVVYSEAQIDPVNKPRGNKSIVMTKSLSDPTSKPSSIPMLINSEAESIKRDPQNVKATTPKNEMSKEPDLQTKAVKEMEPATAKMRVKSTLSRVSYTTTTLLKVQEQSQLFSSTKVDILTHGATAVVVDPTLIAYMSDEINGFKYLIGTRETYHKFLQRHCKELVAEKAIQIFMENKLQTLKRIVS